LEVQVIGRKRFFSRAATIAVVVTAVLFVEQGAALAGPGDHQAPPGSTTVIRDGAGTVSVPLDKGYTKAQWIAKYGTAPDGGMSTMAAGHKVSQGWASGPAGSQSFRAYGYTDWSAGCGFWTCTATFQNNYAEISWLGLNPYYANTINASMKWWVGGINVTPWLPPGAGFSTAGSSVTWQPGAINNTWQVTLNYPAGVRIDADVIYNTYFTDQGDILLGTTWYHVQGNS
jgi:hypothetical protein